MSYTYLCAHTSQALQPVVLVPIHHQHPVVQVGLGAEVIVVDTAVVELGWGGGGEDKRVGGGREEKEERERNRNERRESREEREEKEG